MSLINDALKKAQKQRTGDSPPLSSLPGVGGESAARIAKRENPAGFNSLLMRLALGAGGVLLVIVLGGYLVGRAWHRPTATAPAKAVTAGSLAPAPADLNEPNPTEPAAGAKATPAKPAIIFSLPAAPPAAPEPAPALVSSITTSAGNDTLAPAPTARSPVVRPAATAPGKVEGAKATDATKPAGPPVKLDAKAIVFIENLRIAGIRASATESKVLMNDRVYRIGDYVEHTLGLKLTGITADSLTFEDERGGRYTRNF